MAEKKKNSTVGYLLIGLLLLALGATFIIFNDALKVVTIAVGILLVVFSAVQSAGRIYQPAAGLHHS